MMVKYDHHRNLINVCRFFLCNSWNFLVHFNIILNSVIKCESIRQFSAISYNFGNKCHNFNNNNCAGIYPFFSRPKPIIGFNSYQGKNATVTINVRGINIDISDTNIRELWVNVTNDGASPIKRMRARAKIIPIQSSFDMKLDNRKKPNGMSEGKWNEYNTEHKTVIDEIQNQIFESTYGKPVPFSKVLKGTFAIQWLQVDGRTDFEIDLAPKNDYAGAKLIGTYILNERDRKRLQDETKYITPENTRIVAFQLGDNFGTVTRPSNEDRIAEDLAIKFWIIAENLTKEVSEIFRIQIPYSFDEIKCIHCKKGTKEFKELKEKFAL